MKRKLFMDGSILCCVLLAASFVFATEPNKEKNTNTLSASDHYKLKIHGKKLEFKGSDSYSGSKNENCRGKSGVYVQDSILAPRVIRMTKGECPVIVFRVGNDIIYYHNYFKIVLRN